MSPRVQVLPDLFCVCEVPGIEPRTSAACKASVLLPELKPQSGASSQVTLFQQPDLCTLWWAAGAPSMSTLWVLSPADLWAAVRRLEEGKEPSFLPAASGLHACCCAYDPDYGHLPQPRFFSLMAAIPPPGAVSASCQWHPMRSCPCPFLLSLCYEQ